MSVFPPPTTPPAGWYTDPAGSNELRYFDGHRWWPVESDVSDMSSESTIGVRDAVMIIVVLVISLVIARLTAVVMVDRGAPALPAVGVLAVIGYGPALVWAVRTVRRCGAGRWGRGIGVGARPIDLLWGPVVWMVTIVVQISIALVLIAIGVPLGSNVDGLTDTDPGGWMIVALVVTAVVVAPLIEEIVFRGVVLRGLASRLSLPLAVGTQGVLFGLIHVDPALGLGNLGLVVVLVGVGITFGAATVLIGRLAPAVIAHAIFNAVVLVIVMTGVVDRLSESEVSSRSTVDRGSVLDGHVVDQAHVAGPCSDDDRQIR